MIEPPYAPLIAQLPDCLIGFVWLPKGAWDAYETETLYVKRLFWRFGIATLKLRPEAADTPIDELRDAIRGLDSTGIPPPTPRKPHELFHYDD